MLLIKYWKCFLPPRARKVLHLIRYYFSYYLPKGLVTTPLFVFGLVTLTDILWIFIIL
jgi:hypothetical protein